MLQVNPFEVIKRVFIDRDWLPVADVTTRQGLRMFMAHIDGDGLLNFSQVEKGKRSGEVIRDQIIHKYGLPVTASIIESEIIGHSIVYPAKDKEKYAEIAKSIFAIDLVEPSSQTYSHPFYWGALARTRDSYDSQYPPLAVPYDITYEKETVGSLKYINENLVPVGKETNIILWSGNCRIPPEAMVEVEEAGLLNMNGGNTTISNRSPFISQVSPKCISWNFTPPQFFAPIQNENVFNNAFDNGLFGGFTNVIQTMKMTEDPIRLKPLNIYYHFYSADRFDAFYALRKVYDYASQELLHPVFASEFIHQASASRKMEVFWNNEKSFTAYCIEPVPTIRIPISAGYPDLRQSQGIIGFNDDKDQRYLITDNRDQVTVILQQEQPDQPYLKWSTSRVENWNISANTLSFNTKSIRENYDEKLSIGGINKSDITHLKINESGVDLESINDDLVLKVPKEARVEIILK